MTSQKVERAWKETEMENFWEERRDWRLFIHPLE
jgi:hypothetical protein